MAGASRSAAYTAEVVQGIVIGGLLTPLGLTHAICAYAWPRGARSGLAVIIRKREGRPAQLGDVDAARVQAWMHAMAAADLALSTMRARKSTLSSFCAWLVNRGLLIINPVTQMDRTPHRREALCQVPGSAIMDG